MQAVETVATPMETSAVIPPNDLPNDAQPTLETLFPEVMVEECVLGEVRLQPAQAECLFDK